MVLHVLLTIVSGLVSGVLSLLPSFSWPSWFDGTPLHDGTLGSYATTVGSYLHAFEGWINIDAALDVVDAFVAVAAIVLTIKIVRVVISLVTGGGGSAS